MANILVTGATGFVGKKLVSQLVAQGHRVRCAVTQKTKALNAEQIEVDRLENQPNWSEALKNIDVVIHLAARVHVMKDKNKSPLDEYIKINSTATRHLAEQAANHHIKRFIFLSSIKVNGEETLAACPYTELNNPSPQDPYAISKLYAEQCLQEISKTTTMEIVILRPPLIYGPGVKANFLNMMAWVKKKWPLPFGNINNKRHFVFIDNLISAIIAVIDAPNAANQLFLVADNDALSFSELLNKIANEMNRNKPLFSIPESLLKFLFRLPGVKKYRSRLLGSLEVNNSKLKSELGWEPPVHVHDGLRQTVKWYSANPYEK